MCSLRRCPPKTASASAQDELSPLHQSKSPDCMSKVCSPAFRRKFVACIRLTYKLPPKGRTTNVGNGQLQFGCDNLFHKLAAQAEITHLAPK